MMAHEITFYSVIVNNFFSLGLHGLNEAILKTKSLGKKGFELFFLKDFETYLGFTILNKIFVGYFTYLCIRKTEMFIFLFFNFSLIKSSLYNTLI